MPYQGTAVHIEGMDKLVARLNKLPKGARKVLLKTLVEGAKVLRAAIRAETPVGKKARPLQGDRPGQLRRGVRYKASRTARTGQVAYMIGPFGKGTYQRHLVVHGHQMVGHEPNKTQTGTRTRPNAFIQRAHDSKEGAAFDAVARATEKQMDQMLHG